MPSKYTVEVLAPVVAQSTSMHGVLRALGIKLTGGSQGYLRRLIQQHGINTSHFLGQATNRGVVHKGGPTRLKWEEVLVFARNKVGRREDTDVFRRALLEAGVQEVCAGCGLGPQWQGQPLRLQVDHKDGNWVDNRQENLRFLCPNCHTQTDTFGSKNKIRASGGMADAPA